VGIEDFSMASGLLHAPNATAAMGAMPTKWRLDIGGLLIMMDFFIHEYRLDII
jgi:hypothetical protein